MKKLREGHWPIFLLSSTSSFANLFLPIILVRLLSPFDIGIYKTFFVYFSVLPFLVLSGGPLHSIYYWVGSRAPNKKNLINATWTLTIAISALVVLVGIPLESYLEDQLHQTDWFMYLLIICSFLSTPSSHYSEASIALGHQSRGAIFETSFEIIKVIGFILIAWQTKSIHHLLVYYAILLVLKTLLSAVLNVRLNHLSVRTDRASVQQVLRYSLPIAATGCLGVFVDKIDLIILTTKLSPEEFAFYSMGCLAIPPLYLLETSVQKILIPKISEAYHAQESQKALVAYNQAIGDIGHLIIPAVFGLMVFADPIVELLFTSKFASSAVYLRVFALSYLLLLIPHDSVARATGNSSWILKTYLLTTPLSLVATIISANHLPAYLVLLISIFIKFLPKGFGLWYSVKVMQWNVSQLLPRRKLLLQFGLATVLSVASLLVRSRFPSGLQWFLVVSPIFAAVYLYAHSWLGKKGQP